jgi:hypothetical protein
LTTFTEFKDSSGKYWLKAEVTVRLTYSLTAPSGSNTEDFARLPKFGRMTRSKGAVNMTPRTRSDQVFEIRFVLFTAPDVVNEKGNAITDVIKIPPSKLES